MSNLGLQANRQKLLDEKKVLTVYNLPINIQDVRQRTEKDRAKNKNDIAQIEAAIEVKTSEFKPGSRVKAMGLLRPKDFRANLPLARSIIHLCRIPELARELISSP